MFLLYQRGVSNISLDCPGHLFETYCQDFRTSAQKGLSIFGSMCVHQLIMSKEAPGLVKDTD